MGLVEWDGHEEVTSTTAGGSQGKRTERGQRTSLIASRTLEGLESAYGRCHDAGSAQRPRSAGATRRPHEARERARHARRADGVPVCDVSLSMLRMGSNVHRLDGPESPRLFASCFARRVSESLKELGVAYFEVGNAMPYVVLEAVRD